MNLLLIKMQLLKVGTTRECGDFFYCGPTTTTCRVLFELRNDVKPSQRRQVHQKRITNQELERLGLRCRFVFFIGFVGCQSHFHEFHDQKHKGNNAADNVSVVIHLRVLTLLKYILTKTKQLALFTNYELSLIISFSYGLTLQTDFS